jgi:hypothetical protein
LIKTILSYVVLCFAITAAYPGMARHTRSDRVCDPETGDAVRPDIQALNRLKNRSAAPSSADIDPLVSPAAMIAPGDDQDRWSAGRAARIVGYVADVKVGGIETVNCRARSPHDRDTHIDLTVSAGDAGDEAKHVIVEVTPRWRKAVAASGTNWETNDLQGTMLGRCVRITGWMLFDAEHRRESANTAVPGASVWRATAWEIHPVSKIEVLSSCPR